MVLVVVSSTRRAILVKGTLNLQMHSILKKPLGQAFKQSQMNTCFVLGCFSSHKKSGYKITTGGWGTSLTIGTAFLSSLQNQQGKIKHNSKKTRKWSIQFHIVQNEMFHFRFQLFNTFSFLLQSWSLFWIEMEKLKLLVFQMPTENIVWLILSISLLGIFFNRMIHYWLFSWQYFFLQCFT